MREFCFSFNAVIFTAQYSYLEFLLYISPCFGIPGHHGLMIAFNDTLFKTVLIHLLICCSFHWEETRMREKNGRKNRTEGPKWVVFPDNRANLWACEHFTLFFLFFPFPVLSNVSRPASFSPSQGACWQQTARLLNSSLTLLICHLYQAGGGRRGEVCGEGWWGGGVWQVGTWGGPPATAPRSISTLQLTEWC